MAKPIRLKPRVLVKDPHIQSQAALFKLKRKYFSQRSIQKHPLWRQWLSFRKWYLKRQPYPLACGYCGKSPLFKNQKITPPSLLATIDHIHPRAKGGKEYDCLNLVVSCRPCNARKADKII